MLEVQRSLSGGGLLEDGAQRWSYDIGEPVLSSPAVVNGRVYVGANDGQLYCFAAAAPGSDEAQDGEVDR